MAKKVILIVVGAVLLLSILFLPRQFQISVVENVSRADERIWSGTLSTLTDLVALASGPAVILFGLAPRRAAFIEDARIVGAGLP